MSIQVDTSDVLVQALLQDQLDIVLGRIPAGARAEELLFDSLGEEALCVIAGAQNPLAKEKQLSWAELQNMTWVLQQQPSPMRAIINQVFHNARVDIPSSIVETTSIMTLLSLIQQTDMLGVTPVSVVEDYPGRDLLAVLPIKFEARLPPYGLITRRHRIQSSAMQAFMNSVRAEHALSQMKKARSIAPGLSVVYAVLRNTNTRPTMISSMPSMLNSARRLPKIR